MKHFLAICVCLLALAASGNENVLRDPIFRPVSPGWADLGRSDFPFRTLYVNGIVLNGTNLTSLSSSGGLGAGDLVVCSNGVVGWVRAQQYVSAMQTNLVLSSHEILLTNNSAFTMSGSNFFGVVPQLYMWRIGAPSVSAGPMLPNITLTESLWGSYTGTNGWFPLTNGFVCWSNIWLSVVGDTTVGIGSVTIYGLDHPELYGNVISFDGQSLMMQGSSLVNQSDLLSYIHVLAPPVNMAGGWLLQSQLQTNETVTFYNHGTNVLNLWATVPGIPEAFGGTSGTNILINTPATNLVPGWAMETCTNLSGPITWQATTNFTILTNAGIVTFAVPIQPTLQCQFFQMHGPSYVESRFSVPLAADGGLLYHSNTWSLAAATNGMGPGDVKIVNSNGLGLTRVWMSNNVPILTAQ